jgi:hypothetical protein
MRIFLTAATAAALVCGIARANEHTQPPANGDAAVGSASSATRRNKRNNS